MREHCTELLAFMQLRDHINPDRIHEHLALELETLKTESLTDVARAKHEEVTQTLAAQQIEYEAATTSSKELKNRLLKLCEQATADRLVTLHRTATEAQRKTPMQTMLKALMDSFPNL